MNERIYGMSVTLRRSLRSTKIPRLLRTHQSQSSMIKLRYKYFNAPRWRERQVRDTDARAARSRFSRILSCTTRGSSNKERIVEDMTTAHAESYCCLTEIDCGS